MSRKGNKLIDIANNVEIKSEGGQVIVKGPKGELNTPIRDDFELKQDEGKLAVINNSKHKNAKAFHGLYRSLIANMVTGVTDGYSIQLDLNGVGYRAAKQGEGLNLSLGFSHPVTIDPVPGISFDLEGQTTIFVKGIDKEKVGQVAADIIKYRDARKDPYKQKGVKYHGAILRKKVGKKIK